ncbi:MAG: hypothetical protein ABJB76_12710 [Candidatus Nitrosocosmicus sp.]
MYISFKKLFIFIVFFIFLTGYLQSQKTFSLNFVPSNETNSTILPGYIGCFIEYKTSHCDDCPPSCLSDNSTNIIIENKKLSINIDQVFEKSLRQISTVKSGLNKNDTYIASLYLRSLLLKNQIKISELNLINGIIKNIQTADSIVSLGKNVQGKLKILTSDKNSNPIAISIVNITSKSIDLLINSDNIMYTINGNPNLVHDFIEQKKWIMKIIANTIIGCEISGISGCLAASIFTTGIS